MFNIPKSVSNRFLKSVPKFKKVLEIAKIRDLNESDTVQIITDILSEIFGYDKYLEVTSELAIRGTFCDLAININGNIQFLIEAKAIGKNLNDNHLKQAIDYGANKGIQWVVLTNGINWQLHRITFAKPISHSLVCELDLVEIDLKDPDDVSRLFLISKESLSKNARESFFEKVQSVNRHTIGNLICSEVILKVIARETKKMGDGIKISKEEVLKIIQDEVLKRDILEGEEAKEAQKKVKKYERKLIKSKTKPSVLKQAPIVDTSNF